MTICIDSQVIVWGIKRQPTKGQEEMVDKAEYFLSGLITMNMKLLFLQ